MSTVEVKTAELIGPALDFAVFCAIYEGMEPTVHVIDEATVERKPFIKPTGERRDLERGLALGLAALERLDRAAPPAQGGE